MSRPFDADAIVVGGGFAGLTAGLQLAERGLGVQVLERRPLLGGRAYSYESPAGHRVDNGQHLLMGCYRRTLEVLGRVGAADSVEQHAAYDLSMIDPDRGAAAIRSPALPSPFELGVGLLGYAHLSVAERARLLRSALRLATGAAGPQETVTAALDRLGEGARVRKCFWDPLSIAVLNELPEFASAGLLGAVMKRVLFDGTSGAKLVFPRVGLSDGLPKGARARILALGGSVEENARVRSIALEDDAVSVAMADGTTRRARAVITAVPPDVLGGLLPESLTKSGSLAELGRMVSAPIVSVHLWFRDSFESPRMAGFLDGPIHWAFTPPMQPKHGRYMTFVSSGARALIDLVPAEIVARTQHEIERHLPSIAQHAIEDSLVTKERRATYAATPAEQSARPGTVTDHPRLFVAGDWVDTGLPATIESAVVSGEMAATAVERAFSTS